MRRVPVSGALLLVLVATACAAPIRLPEAFVELRDRGQGYRAITSDGARLWVRTLDDPTEGSEGFWADSLRRHFVEQRGRTVVDEGEVEDAAGRIGRWLHLHGNVDGKRIDYLIALWVATPILTGGNRITVVEFAAEHDVFAEREAAVRAALKTVQ